MATTVGEIILAVRRQIPDMPQVMATPAINQISSAGGIVSGGVLTAAQHVFIKVTAVDIYGGETPPSAELDVTVGAGNNAVVISASGVKPPAGFVAFKVYFGAATGAQDQAILTDGSRNAAILGFLGNCVISGDPSTNVPSTPIYGGVPTRNTAFQPDTDGIFFSASSMYQMLNDALDEVTRLAGGITDVTGVQAFNAQLSYRLPQGWFNFTDVWYDGYVMEVVKRAAIFMRNPVPGIAGYASVEHDGISHVLSMWPQPSRTGNVTTLTANMNATQSTAAITAWPGPSTGGAPSMGVVQIGSEQMVFSGVRSTGLLMTGLLRGIGGTNPVAHLAGETVTELNIRLAGKRIVPHVSAPATQYLNLPPAWERAVKFYMMALCRKSEQDAAGAAEELKQFENQVQILTRASRQSTQPRQILVGDETPETYYPNAFGFGKIVN